MSAHNAIFTALFKTLLYCFSGAPVQLLCKPENSEILLGFMKMSSYKSVYILIILILFTIPYKDLNFYLNLTYRKLKNEWKRID